MSPAPKQPLAREASFGYQVNHLARLLANSLHMRFAPLGVVPGQFAQLLALYEEDGLTQRELCDRVRIEQPTMANTLQRMERDGLIRREPDPGDGRRARIMLTSKARKLEGRLVGAARDVNAVATDGLSERQVDTLMRTLTTVIGSLERQDPHAMR